MPRTRDAISVALTNLGDGNLSLDVRQQELDPLPRIDAPITPSARNLRLLDGSATVRPGYAVLTGTAPNANAITGLHFAIFDDGTASLVRFTRDTIHSYVNPTYTVRTPVVAPTGTDTDFWHAAMVRRTGSVSPKNQLFAVNGIDGVHTWTGTSLFTLVAGSPVAGRIVVSFLGRAFVMNCNDSTANRKHARVQWSIAGDPATWTGLGSGFVDLDTDPYAIGAVGVMSGGLSILKGDENGGAIWRATPTGLVNAPLRYDAINPGAGVGIILPRTFNILGPRLAFFVGHDALYIYDGIAGLQPVAETLVKNLLSRINPSAIDAAHAWYKPVTAEIHIAIPTGADTTPTEVWVFNMRKNRGYGPYNYADSFIASSQFLETGEITWDNITDTSWEDTAVGVWDNVGGQRGSETVVLGTTGGAIQNDHDDINEDDNGVSVPAVYETAIISADGRNLRMPDGQFEALGASDMLTLHDVSIGYEANRAWSPVVDHSSDGGATWTVISTPVTLASGNGEIAQYDLTTEVTALRHKLRITADIMALRSITMRFQHAGDSRNG
ncbi:MAG: hypothetical protein V3S43_06380 [Acidimicrobiia bacterium]